VQENFIVDLAVPYRGFLTFPQGQTPAQFFVIEKTDANLDVSQENHMFQLTFWTRDKQQSTNDYADKVISHISKRINERADMSRVQIQRIDNQVEPRANLTSRTVLIQVSEFSKI
jgi:hypothetical protein